MNIELSDEKINDLVEKELRRCIEAKVEKVMNDGKAFWFTQQNIERLTRDVIIQKIPDEFIKQVCLELKKDEFLHRLSDSIADGLKTSLFY